MSSDLVDRIRLGWVVLAEADAPGAGGVATHPIAEVGGVPFLLGLDAERTPCLLVGDDGDGPEEDTGVVSIRNRELVAQGTTSAFVVISCAERSLLDVFDQFLAAVVGAVEADGARHPGAVAADVLARWKALFQGGGVLLGRSELAALLAELLVLEAVTERDPAHPLTVWIGPDGARHDFRRGADAIEVKATLSHTRRQISVHGVDQLEAPRGGTLTLAWYRLEVVPEGELSVFTVVDRLIAAGVPAAPLYARLEVAGSPPSLRDAHDSVRFALRERRFFAVGDGFPRVVAASFAAGVPDGVDDLTYKVTLPGNDAALDDAAVGKALDRMAAAP